jgi:aminoglycoside phosphotransferase (APT) family kinase protein
VQGTEPHLCGGPGALRGGFWAELVRFRLTAAPAGWSGDLVARLMPDPLIAAKETAFQAGVAAQGYPTPNVLAAGGPADGVNGRAFLLMPLAAGQPLIGDLDGAAALIHLPALARRLPAVLAARLAELHRLDPAPIIERLHTTGAPAARLENMLAYVAAAAAGCERPDLAATAGWFIEHPPPTARAVICHGDMHPFNVLVDGDRTTVLDWSAALIAPAGYDLGFSSLLLTYPPLIAPPALRPIVGAAGRALSRRLIKLYERAMGPVDQYELHWYQALICQRALTEVAGWEHDGTLRDRAGHPWLINRLGFSKRLADFTGIEVRQPA